MNLHAVSRRRFLHSALAGSAVLQGSLIAQEAAVARADQFAEPGRNLPLVNDADVIVCGAGPAGVTAAITAARAGGQGASV
jgi:ribulose 1,5-bisphosphate synthetase/thiazole synthase